MASVSGFGMFLGGSKGTRTEYELLKAAGGRALPIGASGGVAYSLWCELRETVEGDLREDFEALGTLTLEDPRLLVAPENLLKRLTARGSPSAGAGPGRWRGASRAP
jgi:hypothetical protein